MKNTCAKIKRGPWRTHAPFQATPTLAPYKQLKVIKHLGEKLGSCNCLYLREIPRVHNEHHKNSLKNLHNEQNSWQYWGAMSKKDLEWNGGREKGLGVGVAESGMAPQWGGLIN